MSGAGRRSSAREREAWRRRYRAFVAPHWRRITAEVLESREAKVLSLRLGIVSDVGLSHEQIARRLHLTSGSISKIEKRALTKVLAALHPEGRK